MISGIKHSSFLTNQMKQTSGLQHKYQKQISSGKKINSAADDAAGLAISEKLLKQTKSLKAYNNNYASNIDANKIAEGGLSGVSDTYNDMYAGSIRAMNGLYSESDINAIRSNNDALKATVDHISKTTKYNENFVINDIDTSFDSLDATAISDASATNSAKRSEIGAQTNGLEHRIASNNITIENETAALSRKQDTEYEKAVSAYKTQQTVGKFQNMLLKNQMSSSDGLVSKLMRQG